MRGSIVLEFLPRQELVLPRGLRGRLGNAMPTAESGQGLIGEYGTAGGQFFMDSDQIPLAPDQQLEDLLPVRFGFLRT